MSIVARIGRADANVRDEKFVFQDQPGLHLIEMAFSAERIR